MLLLFFRLQEALFEDKMATTVTAIEVPYSGLQSSDPALASVFGVLTLITSVINLVNVPFFVTGQARYAQRETLYLFGLLIAGLGIGVVCQTSNTILLSLGRWPFSQGFCRTYDFVRLVLENAGVWMMIVISYDKLQLLSLEYPRYLRIKRRTRVILDIILVFALPTIFHLAGLLAWMLWTTAQERAEDFSPDCQDIPAVADIPFVIIGATVNIFIPGVLLLILNIIVAYKIKKRVIRNMRVNQEIVCGSSTNRRSQGTTRQLTVTTAQGGTTQPVSDTSHHPRALFLPPNGVVTNPTPVHVNGRLVARRFQHTEYRRYIRPAVTLAGLVASFVVCWFPFAIYHVYVHVFCPSCFHVTTQLWLRLLLYTNSAINPVIFFATNRNIRKFHMRQYQKVKRWCSRNSALK